MLWRACIENLTALQEGRTPNFLQMPPTIGHQVHLHGSARRTKLRSLPALDDSIPAVREYPLMAETGFP
jgi:hypothetical protein